jgi:Mn-dependent DtxR family transcriptional regulator
MTPEEHARTIKRLREKGLVTYDAVGACGLTRAGRELMQEREMMMHLHRAESHHTPAAQPPKLPPQTQPRRS